MGPNSPHISQRQISKYRRLVDRAEKLAMANKRKCVKVAAIARALSVDDRLLRKAFERIHGLPPSRHFKVLRLTQARQALLALTSEPSTVTEIATSFGFMELGRFSVEYRQHFGESPSQTLERVFKQ